MTKKEINLELKNQIKHFIPENLDTSMQSLMRLAMNHAFVFGVKTSVDPDSLKEALNLINDWEHQFDID